MHAGSKCPRADGLGQLPSVALHPSNSRYEMLSPATQGWGPHRTHLLLSKLKQGQCGLAGLVPVLLSHQAAADNLIRGDGLIMVLGLGVVGGKWHGMRKVLKGSFRQVQAGKGDARLPKTRVVQVRRWPWGSKMRL